MSKERFYFEHEVDLSKPKKKVYDEIFRKRYDGMENLISIGDLPENLEPTDLIDIHHEESFYSEEESWDAHTIVMIHRPRLETDEEQKERLEKSQQFTDELKERRYNTYLKLKEEFDIDKEPTKAEPKPESSELLPCPNCGGTSLKRCGVYIRCNNTDCLMEGPKSNGGRNDDHADHMDAKWAIERWNALPRKL